MRPHIQIVTRITPCGDPVMSAGGKSGKQVRYNQYAAAYRNCQDPLTKITTSVSPQACADGAYPVRFIVLLWRPLRCMVGFDTHSILASSTQPDHTQPAPPTTSAAPS